MSHPNNMAAWDEISCRRGHEHHDTLVARVDLGRPHRFADLTPVPARLARSFNMELWDPSAHPVDGGPYCPAHDAVSETILATGIWEPAETVLALSACLAYPGATVVDLGAQVGWFSMLAASCGNPVVAVDADDENLVLLERSAEANGWGGLVTTIAERIGPDTERLEVGDRIALAKIDVEGAEDDALHWLRPNIEAGTVEHLLVEVSPVFDDYYPDLVEGLVAAGYSAFVLPPKATPPAVLDRLPEDLAPWRVDDLSSAVLRALVASWRQEMVWFAAPGALWA